MCTLTYIPVHQQDFIFTTNRDEKPGRIALYPDHYTIGNYKMLFPKDSEASGTWMLIHEKNYSLCLLNGAFEKHEHKPPYRKSRGLVVLEYAQYKNTVDFVKHYNFQGIEPFTLVIINYDKERSLEEVRWDASSIHYRKLDAQKVAIWSSATLYPSEIADKRKWKTYLIIKSCLCIFVSGKYTVIIYAKQHYFYRATKLKQNDDFNIIFYCFHELHQLKALL